jgi:hypothetical protein
MDYKTVQKEAPGRGKVEILAETYDEGLPIGEDEGKWRQKLESREEKIKYLQNGEKYEPRSWAAVIKR